MQTKRMYLAPGLSVAADGAGRFVVISPLTGGCARVNEAGVRLLQQVGDMGLAPDSQALATLRRAGLVTARRRVPPSPPPARVPYWSTSVTLMPTARCTMKWHGWAARLCTSTCSGTMPPAFITPFRTSPITA